MARRSVARRPSSAFPGTGGDAAVAIFVVAMIAIVFTVATLGVLTAGGRLPPLGWWCP